jgi:hypothetical protein
LPDGAHITALQVPNATLTSDAKGGWSIAPADKTLTGADLTRFVQTWQQARATGVTAIGGGKPEGEVSIQLAGAPAPLRFQILDDPDYLVLARPDQHLEYQLELGLSGNLLTPSHAVTPSQSH